MTKYIGSWEYLILWNNSIQSERHKHMTEIESLKQQILDHLELAESMTDYDAYAYLQSINTTAWRYIKEHYNSDHKSGDPYTDMRPIT